MKNENSIDYYKILTKFDSAVCSSYGRVEIGLFNSCNV